MVKFPEGNFRKFGNVYICKKCSTKIRAQNMKIIQGRIKCRRCNSKKFRAVRKK
jgi:DNA-directed RNA polymerase subunit RPC12/RpoP